MRPGPQAATQQSAPGPDPLAPSRAENQLPRALSKSSTAFRTVAYGVRHTIQSTLHTMHAPQSCPRCDLAGGAELAGLSSFRSSLSTSAAAAMATGVAPAAMLAQCSVDGLPESMTLLQKHTLVVRERRRLRRYLHWRAVRIQVSPPLLALCIRHTCSYSITPARHACMYTCTGMATCLHVRTPDACTCALTKVMHVRFQRPRRPHWSGASSRAWPEGPRAEGLMHAPESHELGTDAKQGWRPR